MMTPLTNLPRSHKVRSTSYIIRYLCGIIAHAPVTSKCQVEPITYPEIQIYRVRFLTSCFSRYFGTKVIEEFIRGYFPLGIMQIVLHGFNIIYIDLTRKLSDWDKLN